MAFDICWTLKKQCGKAVEYNKKPYMLLGVRYKKTGTEEMFGKVVDVVEAQAELLIMGTNTLFYVPAEEVKPSSLKWDFAEKCWVETSKQMEIAI